MLVVLVSTRRPGPEIFPTHRARSRSRGAARGQRRRAGAEVRSRELYRRERPSSRYVRRRGVARASSTSSSSTGSATRGSRTRPTRPRPSGACATARRTSPTCCGRPGSRTSSRSRARGEVLPQKTTYFFPKLDLRPALPPALSPWLELCRDAVGDIKAVLAELPGARRARARAPPARAVTTRRRSTRRPRRWSSSGSSSSTSTSRSSRRSSASASSAPAAPGASSCDPIDGSLNAKRGIPFFSLSLAVADGADDGRRRLRLRLRLRLGRGVDGRARRRGAFLNGARLGAVQPKDEIEILSFEATTTARGRGQGRAHGRERAPAPDHGLARALALPPRRGTGGRRLLAQAGPLGRHRRRRSCSCASAGSRSTSSRIRRSTAAPLDLVGRSRVVAAGTTELCRTLENALTG